MVVVSFEDLVTHVIRNRTTYQPLFDDWQGEHGGEMLAAVVVESTSNTGRHGKYGYWGDGLVGHGGGGGR